MSDEKPLRSYKSLDARPVPCKELEVTGVLCGFDQQALAWLRQHGVSIEERQSGERNRPSLLLMMPPGTTKQLLYPVDVGARYRVRLPDSAECTYYQNSMHSRPYMPGVPRE